MLLNKQEITTIKSKNIKKYKTFNSFYYMSLFESKVNCRDSTEQDKSFSYK